MTLSAVALSPTPISPAASAFDAIADEFDARFGNWLSVSAQRRAVRHTLAEIFPTYGRILEIGCGTGEDAVWLAERGFRMTSTDAAPRMVELTRRKLRAYPESRTIVADAAHLDAIRFEASDTSARFDGVFSNFAALNCVSDLRPVARGLAPLVRPGGAMALVMFGTLPPGELIAELARGRPRAAVRRFRRRSVEARVSGRAFRIRYHDMAAIERAFAPWFRLVSRRGIGVFIPPSAAEPWISRHPHLLGALEALDFRFRDRLAALGDHVLYRLERTEESVR